MTRFYVSEDQIFVNQTVSDRHFGVNLVTIYDEEFVDPDSGLSENVRQLGAKALRFPGGAATEYYFDMTKPNLAVSSRDPEQTLTPMDVFFAKAGELDVAVAIVIPTQMAFSQSAAEAMLAGTYGDRSAVTQSYLEDVAAYVATAVSYANAQGVEIEAFEIGNEFWGSGEMSAAEYGIVAGEVAVLLDAALNTLGLPDAEIIVQSTSSASRLFSSRDQVEVFVGKIDGETRAFTQQDIDGAFDGVIPEGWQTVLIDGQGTAFAQVSQIAAGINSVAGAADAIDGVVQHYYQSGGFASVDGSQEFKFAQFRRLEGLLDRENDAQDLSYHVTEWNTNSKDAANNRGLQNASMMIENFFELVINDVDVAQIWPLSFDAAQGISLVDLDGPDLSISGEMFRLMSESLAASTPILDWSVKGVIDVHGFSKQSGAVFFVSERRGAFQGNTELDLSQFLAQQDFFITITQLWDGGAGGDNANAQPVTTVVDGLMSDSNVIAFDLDSWANLRVEITYVTVGDDKLIGREGADTIDTKDGEDTIEAGSGNDTVDGGKGNDLILGQAGDDQIIGGEGSDTIDGGSGLDTVIYEGSVSQYTVVYSAKSSDDGVLRIRDAGGNTDLLTDVEWIAFDGQVLSSERVQTYLDRFYSSINPGSGDGSVQLSLAEIAAAPDPTLVQTQLEIGRAWIGQTDGAYWQSVTFSEAILDAAVIMGPASSQGGQSFTVRVRDVSETGFEFQIDEWDYMDGSHAKMEISWLAGTIGQHQLEDGTRISLGGIQTTSLERETIELDEFDSAPIIMGQLAGDLEVSALVHRIDDVAADGFDFRVKVDERSAPTREEIGETTFYYAAVDVATDSFIFTSGEMHTNQKYQFSGAALDDHQGYFADMQSSIGEDPGVVRYKMSGGGRISLKIAEEKWSAREDQLHDEEVAWIMMDQGVHEFI